MPRRLTRKAGAGSVGDVHPAVLVAAYAVAAGSPPHRPYIPAPPAYRVVVDNPTNAGGVNPATGQPYPAVGQYADPATNTVHTTKGYAKRLIAQDVGQLVGYNVLNDGQRHYFSRLLGTDPAKWSSGQGAQPGGLRGGDEAFASYYAVAATGGLKKGESVAMGDTSIDPVKLKRFTAALQRLGRRQNLRPYKP